MILFHGTSGKAAFESLARGIYGAQRTVEVRLPPDGNGGPVKYVNKTVFDAIALSDLYAGHMAHAAVQDHGKWGVVEIDSNKLDQLKLYPTPEALELAFRDAAQIKAKEPGTPEHAITKALTGLDVDQRLQWFRERLGQFQNQWGASLQFNGFALYHGHIPSAAIRRVCMLDPQNPVCHLAVAPIGDPKAHVRDRERHAAIMDWIMGGPLTPAPFTEVGIDGAELADVASGIERRVLKNR